MIQRNGPQRRGPSPRRAIVGLLAAAVIFGQIALADTAAASPSSPSDTLISSTGLTAGQIKHVWLIILENKSYDATFTGLNQNSYLWNTLPSQGALLVNYYGTGHYSMDNYITLVSGQAPQPDTQMDCDVANTNFGTNADIVTSGENMGQLSSPANADQPSGANAPDGQNGCTYPTQIPTLFNQLDSVGQTWKGYAQDFRVQPGREDATCGAPGSADNDPTTNPTILTPTADNPLPDGVVSFTGAQANDQYVAKHFPFAWFSSLSGSTNADGTVDPPLTTPVQGGTDCDENHVANIDDPTYGLFHDLQSADTTPAFSWITPNNCNDAHDAVCKGNNLSGAFDADGQPIYGTGTPDPQSTTPVNYTGGLYASDLFLQYYIPMIEQSPAFKDGGLIDITFDEAFPPFTYSNNSFNNADAYEPLSTVKADAAMGIDMDSAGQNINGENVDWEPTGPNSTLATDADGNQLYPGPGWNAWIDRPPVCTQTEPTRVPANCVPGIVLGGAGTSPAARTDTVTGGPDSSVITDQTIISTDTGRMVTDTVDTTGPDGASPIPADTFVGTVTNTGPLFPSTPSSPVVTGAFQLVDQAGNPVTPTGSVTSVTLSAEGAPGYLTEGQTVDPLYNANDPTPGGGITGSVLISPLITPGTVSDTFYNHYSWLRTMEDIFQVSSGDGTTPLAVGTVSGGIDGLGHLGFAAQDGLAPFGPDVFTNAAVSAEQPPASETGSTPSVQTGGTVVPSLALSLAGVVILIGIVLLTVYAPRTRRHTGS